MAKFKLLSPLRLAGRTHEPGDLVELDDEDIAELQSSGVIGEAEAEETAPTEKAERLAAIRAAVEELSENDFTVEGKPKVEAVEARLGWNTSRAEITEAQEGR